MMSEKAIEIGERVQQIRKAGRFREFAIYELYNVYCDTRSGCVSRQDEQSGH